MAAVKLQFAKARELEQWLTERCAAGGSQRPARRTWRPANTAAGSRSSSPSDARAAIAKGQLAVVLGIEEASLFGCKVGTCTPQTVQAALEEYQALGVRHIFPVHNFDNGFGAAATWMDRIEVANPMDWPLVAGEHARQTPANGEIRSTASSSTPRRVTDFLEAGRRRLSRGILHPRGSSPVDVIPRSPRLQQDGCPALGDSWSRR